MGKFFNPKKNKASDKLRKRHYTPMNIIASKIYNDMMRSPESNQIDLSTPEYVHDWIKMLG